MYKFFFLILFSVISQVFAQRVPLYSIANNKFDVNIDHQSLSNPGNYTGTGYNNIANIIIGASPDNYGLSLSNYINWENDPGDFRVITLTDYKTGKEILQFIDQDAWVKIPSELKYKSAFPNDYCLIYPMENGVTAIIFIGHCYQEAPKLTIIAVREDSAAVVFNKSFFIDDIKASENNFEITICDNHIGPNNSIKQKKYILNTDSSGIISLHQIKENKLLQ